MKKLQLIILLSVYCLYGHAQTDSAVSFGTTDSIFSTILNEQRRVLVYVPDSNEGSIFSKKSYPVVYLLDGDAFFLSVVATLEHLSANQMCPQMIVVGIPNTNRNRDLTPSKGELEPPFMDSTFVANTGGGEKFLSFIEQELILKIDSKYPTEPYRMFIGHSFGGLEVMHAFAHKPHLFSSYIAIDPSMSWSNQLLLKKIKSMPFKDNYSNKALYLGIANNIPEGLDTTTVLKDTSMETEHIRSVFELNTYLNTQTQLKYKGNFFPEESHGSLPFIAHYDAFRFIFDFYELKFEMQDFMNPETDIVNKVLNHYKKLSTVFGREMKPDEQFVNGLGYQFLQMRQFKVSEQFFKLNVTNFPESFNVYDSIGDYYVAHGDKDNAIESFKKALALNKDARFSKDKLEALLGD